MKRLFSIPMVIILLVGCAPSSEAIQKAIEQTQAAMPTVTPTITPIPTATSIPLPSLEKLLITNKDFHSLKVFYEEDPLYLKEGLVKTGWEESLNIVFLGKINDADAYVKISLYRFLDEETAKEIAKGPAIYDRIISPVRALDNSDDYKSFVIENKIISFFHYKELVCVIETPILGGTTYKEMSVLNETLSSAQYIKFKEAYTDINQ